jgi:hypothetical protein
MADQVSDTANCTEEAGDAGGVGGRRRRDGLHSRKQFKLGDAYAKFDLCNALLSQQHEGPTLLRRELARGRTVHREGAQHIAGGGSESASCIGTDGKRADHALGVAKALVQLGIRDLEHLRGLRGIREKGFMPRLGG